MSIHKIGSDLIRPFGPRGPDGSDRSKERGAAGASDRGYRRDRVELSAEARAAAEEAAGVSGLDPSRFLELRERVSSGFYDDPSVAEAVAQRIIEAGELD